MSIEHVDGLTLHLRDDTTDYGVFHELWGDGPDEYAARDLVDPQVIIDIGANVGLFTVLMCHLYPSVQVWAYEPERDNFACLTVNVAANGFQDRVHAVQSAVWSHAEGVTITGGRGDWAGLTETHEGTGVRSVTIDTILGPHPHVDLLKCDTEGAELTMFEPATLLGRVGRLVLEVHDDHQTVDTATLLTKLEETHRVEQYRFPPDQNAIWRCSQ